MLAHSYKGGSNISAHVLFNLLKELRKRDTMHELARILLFFDNADLLKSVSDYYKRVCYNTVTMLLQYWHLTWVKQTILDKLANPSVSIQCQTTIGWEV